MDNIDYRSEESLKLHKLLLSRGYHPDLCMAISLQLSTPWTASRMLGYLRDLPDLKEEDIVDEMLAILYDRDRIRQKKEMEYYQGKINEMYRNGLTDEEEGNN